MVRIGTLLQHALYPVALEMAGKSQKEIDFSILYSEIKATRSHDFCFLLLPQKIEAFRSKYGGQEAQALQEAYVAKSLNVD